MLESLLINSTELYAVVISLIKETVNPSRGVLNSGGALISHLLC